MKTINFICLISIAGLLASCYPKGPDTVSDFDLTVTTYDETYDFKSNSTYSIPDKIVTGITISQGDTTYEYMNQQAANSILSAMKDQMNNYGWSEVDVDANPDMVLVPGTITTTNYFYSYWYNWWYGGYYWYYPPYYSASSYTTGTLLMVLADPNESNILNTSEAKWIGACNGILSQTGSISRVVDAVDQAFEQSEYLELN